MSARRPTEWSAPRRGKGHLALQEQWLAYVFISPWLIGLIVLEAGPLLAAVYLSFTNFDLVDPPKYIGLKNFERMLFHDPLVWHSLEVTAIYSVGTVALHLVFGLSIALLLNQNLRGIAFYRTVYYLPAVVSGVAVALMWVWVFNPEVGIVNSALRLIGIQGPDWFFSLSWTLPTFILISSWDVGGAMVLYLAGLQGVPTVLYEAAQIDGAGKWTRLWHVTIPLISPVIFFNLVVGIIGSFQVFTSAYVITQGGPANATLFYVLNLYVVAFQELRMGYAAALAWLLFAIILGLTFLTFRSGRHWVYYEGLR